MKVYLNKGEIKYLQDRLAQHEMNLKQDIKDQKKNLSSLAVEILNEDLAACAKLVGYFKEVCPDDY